MIDWLLLCLNFTKLLLAHIAKARDPHFDIAITAPIIIIATASPDRTRTSCQENIILRNPIVLSSTIDSPPVIANPIDCDAVKQIIPASIKGMLNHILRDKNAVIRPREPAAIDPQKRPTTGNPLAFVTKIVTTPPTIIAPTAVKSAVRRKRRGKDMPMAAIP